MLEVMIKLVLVWLGSLLVTTVLSLIVALPVSVLWNVLLPTIFSVPKVSYLQAAGLVLLVHLIFRGAKARISIKA